MLECGRCTTAPTARTGRRSKDCSGSCTAPAAYPDSDCVRPRSLSRRCSMAFGSKPASIRAPSGLRKPWRSARTGRMRSAPERFPACSCRAARRPARGASALQLQQRLDHGYRHHSGTCPKRQRCIVGCCQPLTSATVPVATACPDCGTLLSFPPLPRRSKAICLRCHNQIETTIGRSVDATLACAVATLALLPLVDMLPLLSVELLGQHSHSSLVDGVVQLWRHDWIVLAGLSVVFVIVLPALRMALLTLVLGTLRLRLRPSWLGRAFRWTVWLDRWAMLDVFLLSVAVGYYYLTTIEHLELMIEGGGQILLVAGALTTLSRATLDERTVWRAIGGEPAAVPHAPAIGCRTCGLIQSPAHEGAPCPRC